MVSPKQSTFHAETVWKTLVRASVDRKHPWRVTNFCTLSEQGPQARSVILREVNLQECELLFYTDSRSGKVRDLSHSASVSLLFWNPSSQEQLRVLGVAELVKEPALIEKHFSRLNGYALKDYASLSAPGSPVSPTEFKTELQPDFQAELESYLRPESESDLRSESEPDFLTELLPDPDVARRNFCVIRVAANKLDYLKLQREGHLRFEMNRFESASKSGVLEWSVRELTP